ncbi:GxxExxY protein [Desulfonema magnum]|uniref:GxxExxY domain-containing protein n=1 Tax=Desulfonema magnum TaxID=45655 RepID=A0A975GS14_9BACT|nr:GxxExxY protein [Desulfonema magnum]QTA90613.1 GxxExxY domain-containing protein [Desulfonema magnum]
MSFIEIESDQIKLPPEVVRKLKGKKIQFVEFQNGFLMKPVSEALKGSGASSGVQNYQNFKYKDITGRIIDCAMRVHSALGPGFLEVIYQRALAIEFQREHLVFKREVEMPIYYPGHHESIGKRRVDFLVENVVFVELKAKSKLTNDHYAQTINYLEAHRVIEISLLFNFGEKSLKWKRFVKSKS